MQELICSAIMKCIWKLLHMLLESGPLEYTGMTRKFFANSQQATRRKQYRRHFLCWLPLVELAASAWTCRLHRLHGHDRGDIWWRQTISGGACQHAFTRCELLWIYSTSLQRITASRNPATAIKPAKPRVTANGSRIMVSTSMARFKRVFLFSKIAAQDCTTWTDELARAFIRPEYNTGAIHYRASINFIKALPSREQRLQKVSACFSLCLYRPSFLLLL